MAIPTGASTIKSFIPAASPASSPVPADSQRGAETKAPAKRRDSMESLQKPGSDVLSVEFVSKFREGLTSENIKVWDKAIDTCQKVYKESNRAMHGPVTDDQAQAFLQLFPIYQDLLQDRAAENDLEKIMKLIESLSSFQEEDRQHFALLFSYLFAKTTVGSKTKEAIAKTDEIVKIEKGFVLQYRQIKSYEDHSEIMFFAGVVVGEMIEKPLEAQALFSNLQPKSQKTLLTFYQKENSGKTMEDLFTQMGKTVASMSPLFTMSPWFKQFVPAVLEDLVVKEEEQFGPV